MEKDRGYHRGMFIFAFLIAVLLPSAVPAQPQPDSFKSLEFVVGSCWLGTFPDGKQTDEHCFEWVYDKKLIRDRHVVRGGGGVLYQGETIYNWNPTAKRLEYVYWNSDGMAMPGQVEPMTDGVRFLQQYPTDKGPIDMRVIWTRGGSDSYRVQTTMRSGDTWTTVNTMEMTRRPRR